MQCSKSQTQATHLLPLLLLPAAGPKIPALPVGFGSSQAEWRTGCQSCWLQLLQARRGNVSLPPRAQLQLMPGVRAHLLCKRVARISLPDLDRLGYRDLVQS